MFWQIWECVASPIRWILINSRGSAIFNSTALFHQQWRDFVAPPASSGHQPLLIAIYNETHSGLKNEDIFLFRPLARKRQKVKVVSTFDEVIYNIDTLTWPETNFKDLEPMIRICLFNWLLCVETHLSPDGTRLKQNAQASLCKHAGQLANGNVKERETALKIWDERKDNDYFQ